MQERNRFYALGSRVFLDDQNTYFPAGTYGEADTATNQITWFPSVGPNFVWSKTYVISVSNALITITAVNPDELALSRRYDIDFSNLLSEGCEIEEHVTVTKATSTGCDLVGGPINAVLAHRLKKRARGNRSPHAGRGDSAFWRVRHGGSLRRVYPGQL